MNALIKKIKNSIFFLFLLPCLAVNAQNPLTPLKLDTPRDTLKMFMNSMNDYKKGVDKNDEEKKLQIDNAMRCLDLREISPLLREEKGKEAAIFLKEAIDRVYIMDLNKVPDTDSLPKWAIPDTEITILKNTTGSRVGEYLFSAETVLNAGDYYRRTKHLPFLAKTGGGAAYSLPWMETIFPKWAREKLNLAVVGPVKDDDKLRCLLKI
jgi:MscS family membrane protein